MTPRPREKLRSRGAASLSTFELAQLVIGSGNANVGVKSIARRLARLISSYGIRLSLAQVMSLRGIGVAKASQIVAMCELAYRYYTPVVPTGPITKEAACAMFTQQAQQLRRGVMFLALDAAGRVVKPYTIKAPFDDASDEVRLVVASLLSARAISFYVCAVVPYDSLHPSQPEALLSRLCYQQLSLLGITCRGCFSVTAKGLYEDKF